MLKTRKTDRRGFSMIEVLVASTILTVIVMMLGMLFQSTGLAWRTGVQRADTFMQVRGFFGAIQRDLSAAIDARDLPATLTAGRQQQFSSSALKFFTLSGKGFDSSGNPYRALTYITYDTGGNRTEQRLKAAGGWDAEVSYNVMTSAERQINPNKPKVNPPIFDPVYAAGASSPDLPLYVNIKASVRSSGYTLEIGAASAGPDMTWDTKDDITTWMQRK